MHRSPLLALGLSAVLPGAGQIYVGTHWWYAPIILGGIGGFLYGAYLQNERRLDAIASAAHQTNPFDSIRYLNQSEFYRDDRDKYYIYAALVYIANLLDAYISAHLYDFDVSEPKGAFLEMPHSRDDAWRLTYRMRF